MVFIGADNLACSLKSFQFSPLQDVRPAQRSCDLQNAVVTKILLKSLEGNNSFLINHPQIHTKLSLTCSHYAVIYLEILPRSVPAKNRMTTHPATA